MTFINLFKLIYFGMVVNCETIGFRVLSHIFNVVLGVGGVFLPHT